MRHAASSRPTQRGFTLMEVMIGLALLGVALTVLIKSAGNSIFSARQAQMMGVVTDLSRSKMYDIEEKLIKDGFTDTDQSEGDIGEPAATKVGEPPREAGKRTGECFEDEGWPNICYAYRVELVELPSFEELQQMAQGRAAGSADSAGSGRSGSGSGSGSDFVEEGGFQNSALGGMLGQLGGGLGGGTGGASGDIDSSMGAAFIQGQYQMVQQTLKASIRKVTLVVWYDVMGRERDLKTVAFFTDPSAMDKVLSGLGSQELPEDGAGAGSGTGGRGSGASGGRTPGGTGRGSGGKP